MAARETRCSSPHAGQGYRCMTEVVCSIMRMAAAGPVYNRKISARLDFTDAAEVQDAWRQLGPRHRVLLRDVYVLERAVPTLCRELNIRHWPASHFHRELQNAQEAIDKIVSARYCSCTT